jgi:hypothetical protein
MLKIELISLKVALDTKAEAAFPSRETLSFRFINLCLIESVGKTKGSVDLIVNFIGYELTRGI